MKTITREMAHGQDKQDTTKTTTSRKSTKSKPSTSDPLLLDAGMDQRWIDAHKDLGIWDPTVDKEIDQFILSIMPQIEKLEKAHMKSMKAKASLKK